MLKRKLTQKIAAIVLVLTLCMSLIPTTVWASPLIQAVDKAEVETASSLDQKVYCDATLEDDFADDTILVTINKERSFENRDFTVADFPEIDCAEVEEITKGVRELIWEQQAALQTFARKKGRSVQSVHTVQSARKLVTEELKAEREVPDVLLDIDKRGQWVIEKEKPLGNTQ